VTVTVTDNAAYSGSASFAWAITGAVSVTNPGSKSSPSGTAIPALSASATDSSSGTTLTWSATGLPGGLSISSAGLITGTPTSAGTYAVTLTATDNLGYAGTADFTWIISGAVAVANPGNKSNTSGSAIAALANTATDSSPGATLTWSATGLPNGLSINTATGSITGTPTVAGTYSVTLTATDNLGYAGSASFTWTIAGTVSVTNPGAQSDAAGSAIAALANTATDTSAATTITWSASGLPTGLSLNTVTGAITGTPTVAGTYAVALTATDNLGYSGSASFTWTVTSTSHTVSVTNPGAKTSAAGSAITALGIVATDSSPTATLAYAESGLPTGLDIDAGTGSITGTPTSAGTYAVTVTVTDNAAFAGSASFSWTVTGAVAVTNPGAQSDAAGAAITALASTATDTSASTSLTWSATGLPTGLSISSATGAITGTPAVAGTYAVSLSATDNLGYAGSASFTWAITGSLSVANLANKSSISGNAISALTPSATDTSAATSIAWSATGLPTGLSLNTATGTITGTPTTAGAYPVSITATDNLGFAGSASFTWTITGAVAVTNPGAQSSVSGSAITTLDLVATDTSAGASFTWAETGLPTGLSLSTTGAITGTPTTAGAYAVTVTATDNGAFSGSASFTWTVSTTPGAHTVSVTNPGAKTSAAGSAITALGIVATDSSPTATLSYAATNLPAGLAIDAGTGSITGTPTSAGTYAVTVTVTDNAAFAGSASFTWTVTGAVAVTNPGSQSSPSGSAITALANSATDTSASTTLTWSATGLPTGLSISSATGLITGTPTSAGTYNVTLTAVDNFGAMGAADFTWTVSGAVSVANPGNKSSVAGTAISALSDRATDTQPGATFIWSATGLPTGLSLNTGTGSITGTPTVAGTFSVSVIATDNLGYSGSASFTWTIVGAVSVTSPGSQSSASGAAIAPLALSANDTQAGATFTWSATGLPTGLSLNTATGTITGTPSAVGNYTVSVTATDGSGFAGSASFSWFVGAATTTHTVSVTNPGDQSDVPGSAIAALNLTAGDSQAGATLTWAATGLPTGLSISAATGTITGMPTTAGTYNVTVTATDGSGASGSAGFTWAITGTPVINTVTVAVPANQTDVSGTVIATLGNSATDSQAGAAFTWSASDLPAGLSVNWATGDITGTPTTAGDYPVTVTATDASGFSGSATLAWTITSPAGSNTVTLTNPGAQSSATGTAVTALVNVATDSAPAATIASWSATGLPAGLSIGPSTGIISGTPTTAGAYSVTLAATDSSGAMGAASFTWTVTGPVSVTNPGACSDVSGTAINPMTATATDAGATIASWSAIGLPAGLSIGPSTGIISGTPTTAGAYSVTLTATDSSGAMGAASFTWAITTPITPAVTVASPGPSWNLTGTAITPLALMARDTQAGTTFTWSATGLPAGLSIGSGTGIISGTPTTPGSYPVTLTATDNHGVTGSVTFTWTITSTPPSTGPAPAPRSSTVLVTNPGNQSNASGPAIAALASTATGTSANTTFTWSATGLPAGLSIASATGTITGRPTTTGVYAVTLTATDDTGFTGSASFTWTITSTVTVTNPGSRSNLLGMTIAPLATTATGTTPGATVTWSATGLPFGLSINAATGAITGTPNAAGTYSVTITATDSSGSTGAAGFTWTITRAAGLSVTTVSLAAAEVRTGYSQTLAATGGTAPYSWSVTTGVLPTGLSLKGTTGTISGKPAAGAKTTTFGVTVTDSSGQTAARSYTIAVTAASVGTGMLAAMPDGKGYWLASANGGVRSFGAAVLYGSMGDRSLHDPVVGIVSTPDGAGYWLVASDGGVFNFGDAHFYGSTGRAHLANPIVGMAATPDGKGYWLVSSGGRVFCFGDARPHASKAGLHSPKLIVGMAATPDGRGYWLVASGGAVFTFGDARFHGSAGNTPLARPIVGMAATPDGRGYWLVAGNGRIFAFGDAGKYGSMTGRPLAAPIVAIVATPGGKGYWLAGFDGGIFNFGDATFYGSGA
jgi:hypothetical protein